METERAMGKITVKGLCIKNNEAVDMLDEISGNHVYQHILDMMHDSKDIYEESDYAFGIFDGKNLIGYCTIGYADGCPDCVEKYPQYDSASLLLSDVFVVPECRGKGIATKLVDEAIQLKAKAEPDAKSIFLTVLDPKLGNFYALLGFEWVDKNHEYMVKTGIEIKNREINLQNDSLIDLYDEVIGKEIEGNESFFMEEI